MIALKKLHENHTPEEASVSGQFLVVRAKIQEVRTDTFQLFFLKSKHVSVVKTQYSLIGII